MKKVLLASMLALGLAGCVVNFGNSPAIPGSGHVISEARDVSQFHSVSVGGSGELEVIQGPAEGLTIETDDNLMHYIQTGVSGGHLAIEIPNANLRPSQTIHYRLQVKDLNAIQLSGSLSAHAPEIKTGQLDLAISGSGHIKIGHLEAQKVATRISGSGHFELAGEVVSQAGYISGSGALNAQDLRCQNAEVSISGSGDAIVWVQDRLSASISGSGSINYYGRPNVDIRTSGSGRSHSLGDK
jgi:hypothetical protein